MQNEKKHPFFEKIRDKGYYIVLGLCVAAVGVSGYLFSRSMKKPSDTTSVAQKILSAAPSVTLPSSDSSGKKSDSVSASLQAVFGSDGKDDSDQAEPTEAKITKTSAPVEGEIMQAYSMDHLAFNATTKDWRTHDGVDFLAPVGTEVHAAADGKVEAVFTDDFLGKTVTVRHADGYVTRYANLAEEVAVSVGQTVQAGDVLGTVGQTALLEVGDEPHLHFSVCRYNVSVDPEAFLS